MSRVNPSPSRSRVAGGSVLRRPHLPRWAGAVVALPVLLAAAALALVLAPAAMTPGRALFHGAAATQGGEPRSGFDFTIASTITELPGCGGPIAPLLPGVDRCLTYVVANRLDVPITVTRVAIVSVQAPAACPAVNLDLASTSWAGAAHVAARGSTTLRGPQITLRNRQVNQDSCKLVTFTLQYEGSAAYAAGTRTLTTLSIVPAAQGRGGVFTVSATVRAPGSRSVPTGSVGLYRCTDDACADVELVVNGPLDAAGRVRFSGVVMPLGRSRLFAAYPGSNGFSASNSPILTRVLAARP